MKQVGILGGTGEIGKRVLDVLKGQYSILASYKNNKKESSENCKYVKVDVSNEEEIKKFCSECDILVNCAGASYINGETVSRIATEYNIPYIDPSGETFLEDRICDIKDNNVFILSSGYFPGMTGFLMNYLCKSFEIPEEVLGLSISEEIPSRSAIEDFILTNLSGFGFPLNYYENGQVRRDEREFYQIIKNKEYTFQNYLTVETRKIAERFLLKKANWYNSSLGKEVTQKMQEAVIKFKLDNSKEEYNEAIDEIRKAFIRNLNNDRKFCYLRIEAKGISENKRIFKKAEICSNCSSEISAIVAAYTVKAIINSKIDNGIYYAMDIINANELLRDLPKLNIEFNINEICEGRDLVGDYEEGEL